MTKFPRSKTATLLASALLFVALWAVIAAIGWSGASTEGAVEAPAAPAAASPAPQTIIQRIHVVRRIHEAGVPVASVPSSQPDTAPAPVPALAAPPPQPAPQPAPAPAPCPKKISVACSRGS